jgi:hypothetical protein
MMSCKPLERKCSALQPFDTSSQNLAFILGLTGKPETETGYIKLLSQAPENFGFQFRGMEEDSGSCCTQKVLCLS